MAAKGCHAVSFSENPAKLKLPSFHSDHWDPFWSACCDEGTIVCLHIGSSSSLVVTAPDAPIDVLIALQPVNIVQAAADLLWSPVLRKFPDLRVSLSEGGIGWIPYFLDRMDWIYTRHHGWTGQDFGDDAPEPRCSSEQVVTCFIDDPCGDGAPAPGGDRHDLLGGRLSPLRLDMARSRRRCSWPSLDGVPENEIEKMTHENAMRHFRFDPFAHRPKEQLHGGRAAGAGRRRRRDTPGVADGVGGGSPDDEGLGPDPKSGDESLVPPEISGVDEGRRAGVAVGVGDVGSLVLAPGNADEGR